jgi:hypothetical protein
MKQTKKGNAWHFGLKAHIGADAGTGMVHSVEVTGANAHDLDAADRLIRKDDEFVNADAGYTGSVRRYKRTSIWPALITGLTGEKGRTGSGMPKCIRIRLAILIISGSRTGTGISNT